MKVGRPAVSEKKKQIPRTIKFDTEEEAKVYCIVNPKEFK